MQTNYAQNVKHFNNTFKRNNLKRGYTAIDCWWYNTHFSERTCLYCSIYHLLAWHPSQLLKNYRVPFVQALQTSNKTTTISLVTCTIDRAKTLACWIKAYRLSSRLCTRSQFGWSFASCTLSTWVFFFVHGGCPSRILLPNEGVSPPSFPAVGNLSQGS